MMEERPWFAEDAAMIDDDARLHAPATVRNRDIITAVLERELPDNGVVVEIASGSGEHVVHFARYFPSLKWQPTDPDPMARASIAAWAKEEDLPNVRRPLDLDTASAIWPVDRADALLCINMTHISPWEATVGLFASAVRLLGRDAPIILYGPFTREEEETAPSNIAFDAQLRARDPRYGLRAVEDIDALAQAAGLRRTALYPVPAHNLMLVYRGN